MEEFSPICQRYTDVMAHKYYLQHLLLNETIAPAVRVNLTSVIVKLQAMGYSLENVQVRTYVVYTETCWLHTHQA